MYKYCTYKFYLADGRRIAAFAEETDQKDKLKIYLFYCSKKDSFSKANAKYFYNLYIAGGSPSTYVHPQVFTITIDPTIPKKSFLNYMYENYCIVDEYYESFVQRAVVDINGNRGANVGKRFKKSLKLYYR